MMGFSLQKKHGEQWKAADFINNEAIETLLQAGKNATPQDVKAILAKAEAAKGLTPEEASILLHLEDETLLAELYAVAGRVKERIYGKRVVLFAPLYISDHCINDCTYCGYRKDHKFNRRKLSQDEVAEEVKILESMGHKRLAVEAGEHPQECPIDYVLESLQTIYAQKFENGSIRRANINIAADRIENYAKLKEAGIGTYILFQETYHRPTYEKLHPGGPKADYDWHTTAHHRAMKAGIDDVGFGVLFGLYDYKFEVIAMLLHALDLEKTMGVGPHTVSVPRMRPAAGVNYETFPYLVNDNEFAKIVAILRLAVPYAGIILSTRENAASRDKLLAYGVSQVSAGSCTGVGGYQQERDGKGGETPQFYVDDHRSTDDMLTALCESGWLPSFCTACYRQGRTGDRFMELAKSGEIQNVCQPNAILTFKEFLIDYATPELKELGERVIQKHLADIKRPETRKATLEKLAELEAGKRDIFF
ncbi:[FeFe] hydrogenase H-cluster radical SAM maturase HydG [Azotosporobacter soli]|uniref:[FeFe] hydrogenase H-cluster radical SAM maturase HydG n=1 Tax=Azotosporobacter soli TaxID=3055040 RepID=UPI0031FE8E0C